MRYSSKQALLEDIQAEHEALMALIESIPANQRDDPGVWGKGWSVKDLMAHLDEWHRMFLRWHRDGVAGRRPAMPAAGYKWSETPKLNQAIYEKHKGKSWRRVITDFERSYGEVLALARNLSEDEILKAGAFGWTSKNPLRTYLGANTASHYRFAIKRIRGWMKSCVKKR